MRENKRFHVVEPYYYWLSWGFLLAMTAACVYLGWIIQWRHTNTAWQNFWGVGRILVPCILLTFLFCNTRALSKVSVNGVGVQHRACLGYELASYTWQQMAEVGVIQGEGATEMRYLYVSDHVLSAQERERMRRHLQWLTRRKHAPIRLAYTKQALDAVCTYWRGPVERSSAAEHKVVRLGEKRKKHLKDR